MGKFAIGSVVEVRHAPGLHGKVFATRTTKCGDRLVWFTSPTGEVLTRQERELRKTCDA